MNAERIAIQKKKKQVEELKNLLQNYKVVGLIDARKLKASLIQEVKKKLEGKALIKFAKKAVANRVIREIYGREIDFPCYVVMSNLSAVELAREIRKIRKPMPAKEGDIAPFDIEIEPMETMFPPGPILTEFKQAGLKVQIKGGKIAITEKATLVKKGEKINAAKAKVLQRLEIFPFEAVTKIVFLHDGELYYSSEVLEIEEAEIIGQLKEAANQAFNLSFNANIPSETTISLLLNQAYQQAFNLAYNAEIPTEETIKTQLAKALKEAESLGNVVNTQGEKNES